MSSPVVEKLPEPAMQHIYMALPDDAVRELVFDAGLFATNRIRG